MTPGYPGQMYIIRLPQEKEKSSTTYNNPGQLELFLKEKLNLDVRNKGGSVVDIGVARVLLDHHCEDVSTVVAHAL